MSFNLTKLHKIPAVQYVTCLETTLYINHIQICHAINTNNGLKTVLGYCTLPVMKTNSGIILPP